jgi:hypothetical protein
LNQSKTLLVLSLFADPPQLQPQPTVTERATSFVISRITVQRGTKRRQFSTQTGVVLGNSYYNNNQARGENNDTFLQMVQQGFFEAHMILEQNCMLIQKIIQNQENDESDGMTCNMELIRVLNINITHAFNLYSDLSVSFINYVPARRATNTDDDPSASGSVNP